MQYNRIRRHAPHLLGALDSAADRKQQEPVCPSCPAPCRRLFGLPEEVLDGLCDWLLSARDKLVSKWRRRTCRGALGSALRACKSGFHKAGKAIGAFNDAYVWPAYEAAVARCRSCCARKGAAPEVAVDDTSTQLPAERPLPQPDADVPSPEKAEAALLEGVATGSLDVIPDGDEDEDDTRPSGSAAAGPAEPVAWLGRPATGGAAVLELPKAEFAGDIDSAV